MMAELIRIHSENPDLKSIQHVAEAMEKGALVVYPTDTVYAIGCSSSHVKAIEKVARLKGLKAEKANFALIFHDLRHLADYTKPLDNSTFRLMKKALPGPFTFILEANNKLTGVFKKKKEIGIRVPDHLIPREIVRVLEKPIITTSIHDDDEFIEYPSDPAQIYEMMQDQADIIIDGGYGNNIASTVVDATKGEMNVVREGLGNIEEYL